MKKLLLILLCLPILSSAQIKKRAIMVSLEGLGYKTVHQTYGEIDNGTNTQLNLNLTDLSGLLSDITLGFFVSDKICLGILLNYGTSASESSDNITEKHSFLYFGPIFKYYIHTSDKIYFSPEAQVGIGSSSHKYTLQETTRSTLFSSSVGFGSSIFLRKNFAIEPTIRYEVIIGDGTDWENPIQENIFSLDLNLSFYL